MQDDYTPPLSLSVVIPSTREKRSGIHSSMHEGAKRVYPRFNPAETVALEKACALLDITPASFVRDIAANAADKLLEHYNAYLRHQGSR